MGRTGTDLYVGKSLIPESDDEDLHDGDILCQELGLDVPYVDLLELTIADVFFLVGDACTGASDIDRG
jgi:hypothetical protein